jgi:hypothetical protein
MAQKNVMSQMTHYVLTLDAVPYQFNRLHASVASAAARSGG